MFKSNAVGICMDIWMQSQSYLSMAQSTQITALALPPLAVLVQMPAVGACSFIPLPFCSGENALGLPPEMVFIPCSSQLDLTAPG